MADTYDKHNKSPEAANNIAPETNSFSSSLDNAGSLSNKNNFSASSSYDFLFQKENFRALSAHEHKYVPLYCVGCRRLFAEAEVYGFRRGMLHEIKCWCGAEGIPLAKQDAKHNLALEKAKSTGGQRTKAVAAASKVLPQGKNKTKAALLALFLGFIGIHKFYLGERITGVLYLLWCWTLIPFLISLYEAFNLFQMSLVNFNMTYNIEIILAQIEPQEEKSSGKADVFTVQ